MLALVVPPGGVTQTSRLFYTNHFVVFPEAVYILYFKENNQGKILQSGDIIINWLFSRIS